MEVKFTHVGKAVWEITRYSNGMIRQRKVLECNTVEQAKAVANYYNIRKE